MINPIKIKPPFQEAFSFLLVGNEGFEPPMPDSESGALPLGEFPIEIGTAGIIWKKGGYANFLSYNIIVFLFFWVGRF